MPTAKHNPIPVINQVPGSGVAIWLVIKFCAGTPANDTLRKIVALLDDLPALAVMMAEAFDRSVAEPDEANCTLPVLSPSPPSWIISQTANCSAAPAMFVVTPGP